MFTNSLMFIDIYLTSTTICLLQSVYTGSLNHRQNTSSTPLSLKVHQKSNVVYIWALQAEVLYSVVQYYSAHLACNNRYYTPLLGIQVARRLHRPMREGDPSNLLHIRAWKKEKRRKLCFIANFYIFIPPRNFKFTNQSISIPGIMYGNTQFVQYKFSAHRGETIIPQGEIKYRTNSLAKSWFFVSLKKKTMTCIS